MGNPEDEAEREAGRQGRVAIHHGKPRDACPHGEDSPLRKHWLDGWDAVKKRGVGRPDMSPARGAGYRASRMGFVIMNAHTTRGPRMLMSGALDGETRKRTNERETPTTRSRLLFFLLRSPP